MAYVKCWRKIHSPVFKALAEIGIRNIELFDPATLKTFVPIIKDLGMTPLSTHFLPGYITGNWETLKQVRNGATAELQL